MSQHGQWDMLFPIMQIFLFKLYKVGYGIVSLQAKEAKHSGVKDDLTLTNRSTAITTHW